MACRRLLGVCALMVCAGLMLLCGAAACAEGEIQSGEIQVGDWTVEPMFLASLADANADGQPNALRLVGYRGSESEIGIPDALDVPAGADGRTALLPVVEVGENAFSGNESIASVTMNDGIRSVGAGAFYRCTALEKVRLSAGLTVLEADLFAQCAALREVELGEALREIGSGCFEGCAALERVILPEGVKRIGADAFKNCTALAKVTLPRRAEYVGGHAFANTPWLDAQKGDWVTVGDGVLLLCRVRGERVAIPQNVRMISSAFEGNDAVKEIVFPEGLEAIGEYAFAGCSALKRADCPDGVRWIAAHAFADCTALESVRTGEMLREIGEYAFENCVSLGRVDMADGLKKLGRGAFSQCAALKQFVLPQGTDALEAEVFAGCRALSDVTIPLSVRTIDEAAFDRGQDLCIRAVYGSAGELFARERGLSCLFLRQQNGEYVYLRTAQGIEILQYVGQAAVLEMPDTLDGVPITSIGAGAFQQAHSLRAVTLSAGITRLEDWAFADLHRLEQVMSGENLTQLGENAFSGCVSLREIYLPQGVKALPQSAFEGCARLTVLAETDSDIFALARDAGLNTVDVLREYDAFVYERRGDALTLCGYGMDEREISLPARYAGREVTAVGAGAFGEGRWTIDVPEGYTALESGAFEGCTVLDITLPRSVTDIAEDALRGCEQITIRGYVGSEAEAYARRIGCRFIVRHDW